MNSSMPAFTMHGCAGGAAERSSPSRPRYGDPDASLFPGPVEADTPPAAGSVNEKTEPPALPG